MGTRWTIEVWKETNGEFAYHEFWRGESLIRALWNLWRAALEGYGCISLTWRG
jgi:hypothetical protein